MNPLGGGLIPQNPDLFGFLRTRPGQDIVEAALHFLFAHEHITTALVGFAAIEEVRQALRAAESFGTCPAPSLEKVRAGLREAFLDLCTGCGYCDHCPEGIPVPKLMDSFNHWKLRGKSEAAAERLKWHWNLPAAEAARCTECGQCEQACTQHLPISERLRQIATLSK